MTACCSFLVRLPIRSVLIATTLTVIACSEATVPIIPAKYIVTLTKGTATVTTAEVGDTILAKAQLVDANNQPVARSDQRLSWYFTGNANSKFMSSASSTDNQGAATNYVILGTKADVSEQIGVIDQDRLSGTSAAITVRAGAPFQYTVKAGTLTPSAGSTINVRAQLADKFGNPNNIGGRLVEWSVVENNGGSYNKGVRTNRVVAPTAVRASGSTGTFASPTSTTDNYGVATVDFTVATTIGGSYVINAQDDKNISGATPSINVLPGPPTKLAITVSVTDPPAGGIVVLNASASDAYGNFVSTIGLPVNWSVSGTDATLASTVTSSNQNGVATNQLRTGPVPGTSYTVTATTSANFQATGTSAPITTQQSVALASMASGFGPTLSCGIATDGAAWCWGSQYSTVMPTRPDPGKPAANQAVSALSTSGSHTCAISAGTVLCWGLDNAGQLGDNSRTNRDTPAPINSTLSFNAVSTGSAHTCALTTSGDIYCWGQSANGRLGDGTGFTGLGPVKVAGGHTFTALSSGRAHTCGLTTSGDVYCWGANDQGQLGNGSLVDQSTPSLVTGRLTFIAIAAGDSHSCGLITGGSIYCWGDNTFGEIGDGTSSSSLAPSAVKASTTYTAIAAGGFHSCAIASTAAAYCWGDNTSGELGDPNMTQKFATVPIAVTGGLRFKSISVGGAGGVTGNYYYAPSAMGHTCGITTSGVTYCWGSNGFGELGIGTLTAPIPTPTKISGQQ